MNKKVNIKLFSSKENPTDIVSRGMKPSDLKNSDVWFYGPKFLNTNENKWPELQVGDCFTPLLHI